MVWKTIRAFIGRSLKLDRARDREREERITELRVDPLSKRPTYDNGKYHYWFSRIEPEPSLEALFKKCQAVDLELRCNMLIPCVEKVRSVLLLGGKN